MATIPAVRSVYSDFVSSDTTLTLDVPAGVVDDDILIAWINVRAGGSAVITTPSGWTLQYDLAHSFSSTQRQLCYTRVASSEPGSYDWDSDTSMDYSGSMVAVQDAVSVDSVANNDNDNDEFNEGPSVTPGTTADLIVRCFANIGSSAMYYDVAPGYTEHDELRSPGDFLSHSIQSDAPGSTSATGIETADQYINSGLSTPGSWFGIAGAVVIEGDPTQELAARFEMGLDIAAVIEKTHHLASRLEMGLDIAALMPAYLSARFEMGLALNTEVTMERLLAARFEMGLDIGGALEVTRLLAARFEMGLDVVERDIGPGTGLVIEDGTPVVGIASSTAAREEMRAIINGLREGDEFIVVLPQQGITGMAGVARVVKRTASDDESLQKLSVIQFIPFDEDVYTARQARGGSPPARQETTVQSEVVRQEQEQDTLRRRENRRRGS